jgi:hypothetical protein
MESILLNRLTFLWLTRLWYHFYQARYCEENQVLITRILRIIYSTHEHKVFTNSQMLKIKYNYYINNVFND